MSSAMSMDIHMDDDDDDDDDIAKQAFDSIAAQLRQFTSPKLGTLPPLASFSHAGGIHDHNDDQDISMEEYMSPMGAAAATASSTTAGGTSYDLDAMEWMEQELRIESIQKPAPRTPKRTPLLERADTPVMSNSSTKKLLAKGRSMQPDDDLMGDGDGDNDDDDTDETGQDLSPFKVIPRPTVLSPRALSLGGTPSAVSNAKTNESPFIFRRYHDILWTYLKAKRSLSHRLELEINSMSLTDQHHPPPHQDPQTATPPPISAHTSSSLIPQETRTEVDYLAQLQQLCWANPSSEHMLEGDCWMLLLTLRQLGTAALVWDDDSVSASQHTHAKTAFLQQLALRVEETPAQLLQRLASDQAPLSLQRRYSILQWIQTCLDQQRVQPKKSSKYNPSTTHPDDNTDAPSLVAEDPQYNFLEASLGYILAGRLEDAKDLARSQGQPWRAATWSGGEPVANVKTPNPVTKSVDIDTTGNPARFLWKRQVWKNGRRLLANSNSTKGQMEAAIYSVLANDVQSCLANPNLRTWSQALGATWNAIWQRLEDELLHLHNNHRRELCKQSLPFEGTQYAAQEMEHLVATAQIATISDFQALQLLAGSPFAGIRGEGPFELAMMAFCMGKSKIMEYCQTATEKLTSIKSSSDILPQLRFLTHLTLFLDSLHVSTSPIVLNGITQQKNKVLFQYVKWMESRPELWSFITLYVSLLPEEQLLQWYPTMLTKVLADVERQAMIAQMKELFPDLVLPVLRKTVRLGLGATKASDEYKFQSVQWLMYQEEHAGDALICANLLLRNFFCNTDDDKMETAMTFAEDYLPEDLVERAEQSIPSSSSPADVQFASKIRNARTEHLAFLAYLDAYRTFGKWKDILSETPTNISDSLAKVDTKNLNVTEQEIFKQRLVRDWARSKMTNCQTVLEAADQARNVLYNVLTHPGGWLSFDDDNDGDDNTTQKDLEERTRREHIAIIQRRYLVLAVNLYLQVCEGTASWMSRSLDDTIHLSRDHALEILKEEAFKPEVWYQRALDLATLIADDRHGIHKAIGSKDLQDILSKLAEIAVSKLMVNSK